MKWMVIKGVRYPSSVISAFAAYNMDNPFLKVRIRNKYHIVPFDDVNKMASQMVYLMNNYPDFVQIGRWWISKKAVMSWVPKGQAVDGSGWVISFTLSFGLEGGTRRSVGSLLRGSRSGIERRSSGRRSGWTGSLVAVLTGG